MRSIFVYIFLFAAVATWFAACSSECSENKNALPLAGFYSSTMPGEKISVQSLAIYGIGAPGDSLLSSPQESKNETFLPFRLDCDTTVYVFRYEYLANDSVPASASDTVTFIYSRTPRFVNAECGVSYLFGIREIKNTGTLIDSVVCPNGYIDNTNAENLRIYFATNSAADEGN